MPANIKIHKSESNTKICNKCLDEQSIDEFYKNPEMKDGRFNTCKTCLVKSTIKWRKENPEKTKQYARSHALKSRYGINQKEYDELFNSQKGRCAICGGNNQSGRKLAVDHNHETGEVRSLLCDCCNRGMGFFRHDVELLKRAIDYIRGQMVLSFFKEI